MNLQKLVKKNIIRIILVVIGAIGGFLYWKFIGCKSGTCLIKSVWYYSTLYGMVFGYLIADIILSFIKKRKNKTEDK